MKKIMMLLASAMLLFGVSGQAQAYFDDGHLIQVVYEMGGLYEIATDLGAFAPTTPDAGAGTSFTANPFPGAGSSGAFVSAKWQVAYYVKTSSLAWTSGPLDGQTSANRQGTKFFSPATAVNNKYATFGTAQGQLLQADLNSYVARMDLGDTSLNAGFFGSFIPLKNGEQNLADLGTVGYADSYLYYYADPNTAAAGLQVARIRTNADGTSQVLRIAGKSDQTIGVISFTTGTLSAGGTATARATASSGLAVSFTSLTPGVCTISNSVVTALAAGMCTIAADQAGDSTFNAAPQVIQNLAVKAAGKSSQTIGLIRFTLSSLSVGGTTTASATASSGLAVSFSSLTPGVCTLSGSVVTALALGTCTIAADQAGDSTYNAAPQVTKNLTVLIAGDVNGDGVVDINDALRALQIASGIGYPTASEIVRGDVAPLVNGRPQPDGKLDIGDVEVILRKAVGGATW